MTAQPKKPDLRRPFATLERYYSDPEYRAQCIREQEALQRDVYDRMDCAIERFHHVPAEERIERVMRQFGMGRMQAINHLRARDTLAEKLRGRW
tara:strand:- start:74459 stop:74740 length:282 start_codon:yes stop_codon:yes gene_type:complete